jgi:MFS family permease
VVILYATIELTFLLAGIFHFAAFVAFAAVSQTENLDIFIGVSFLA